MKTALKTLLEHSAGLKMTDRQPALLIGHGNPMNVVTNNEFRKAWIEVGKSLPRPRAIMVVSAHWLTRGTAVTVNPQPKTIHDFYGFPEELYKLYYSAPGAVEYAEATIKEVKSVPVLPSSDWGLDHGAWCVLMHLFPGADIPVYQLSIDYNQPLEYHFKLAGELSFLRERGVMIIGSGNVVHNLRRINWSPDPLPFDWAIEFDAFVAKSIENDDSEALVNYLSLGSLAGAAHPTNDHYIPLIYTQGVRDHKDRFAFFTEQIDMGSVSMRSILFC